MLLLIQRTTMIVSTMTTAIAEYTKIIDALLPRLGFLLMHTPPDFYIPHIEYDLNLFSGINRLCLPRCTCVTAQDRLGAQSSALSHQLSERLLTFLQERHVASAIRRFSLWMTGLPRTL